MIRIATFKGYSYDASYYINGDATGYEYSNTPTNKQGDMAQANADLVCTKLKEVYGKNACIVGCSDIESDNFGFPDYGMQLFGNIVEYTIHY